MIEQSRLAFGLTDADHESFDGSDSSANSHTLWNKCKLQAAVLFYPI
jgi:hypothetical protein